MPMLTIEEFFARCGLKRLGEFDQGECGDCGRLQKSRRFVSAKVLNPSL